MILRPATVFGLISMARAQRSSVSPVGDRGFHHASLASAAMVKGADSTIRSGGPLNWSAKYHFDSSGQSMAAGMSAGLPRGAPPSTQRTTVSISAAVSDRSFLNAWIPTVRSTCHGGICRVDTRSRIDRAQGRASRQVTSDIGAMDPGRWHASHLAWKIGATSLVNVGAASSAAAPVADAAETPSASTNVARCFPVALFIDSSFPLSCSAVRHRSTAASTAPAPGGVY